MKICISEKSVKDFNAFFKAKALELQKKNNYSDVEDLYRALYNEALTLSGDTESMDNHDVVIQHLAIAPMALNNTIPNLQDQIGSDALDSMGALSDPKKLESIVKKVQEIVSTPIDIVEEEIEEVVVEAETEDHDPNGAIHIHFATTQGAETTSNENDVDADKVTAHSSARTIIDKVKDGSKDYKLLAMPYSELESKVKGKLDFSITSKPTAKGAKRMVVFVVADKNGIPVQFDANGNITDTGTIPVFSPLSPSLVNDEHFQYVHRTKDLSKPLHKKFAAIEASLLEEGLTYEQIHKIPTKDSPEAGIIADGYLEGKELFKVIREQGSMLLDINPAISTFGYNEITKNKTQLSDVSNIDNLTLSSEKKNDGTFHVLTGGDLHESQAVVIPNDISSSPELVKTLVELLTNKNLVKENGSDFNAAELRSLVSNYIAVGQNSPIRISASGEVTIYKQKVNAQQIEDFFNKFKEVERVKDNSGNRIITTDLADPNNTSAMLYKNSKGELYKIYKPKFSYNNREFVEISITNGKVTTTPIEKKTHVVKTGSTKAFVNKGGVLKVYHPKLGYGLNPASYDNQPGLNKIKEQKGENAAVTLLEEQHALSWFKGSPLAAVLELQNEKLASEDRPESRVAVARWVENGITLYKGSDLTDIYHEAWHAYTQGILSPADTEKLYASVKKLKGKSNFTKLQIEEYLAEEFRAYAMGKSKLKKTSVIGKFFESIMNFLEKMFGNYSKSDLSNNAVIQEIVTDHFDKLYTGKIDITQYSSKNFNFPTLNKNLEFPNASKGVANKLSAQQTSLLIGTVDSLVSRYLDKHNVDKLSKGYSSVENLKAAYNGALHELIKLRDIQDKLRSEANPTSAEFEAYSNNFEMLDAAVDNFGDVEKMNNNIFAGEDPTNVIGYHLRNGKVYNYNTISDIIQEDDQQSEADVTGKLFERTGNEQSLFDMADEHIVYMLSTVTKQKTVRGKYTVKEARDLGNLKLVNKLKFGQETELNTLGVPVLERSVVVMAKLGKLLNSTPNGDMMHQKMVEASKKDAVIMEVLNKLGPYKSDSLDQTLLWSKFIQTFSKSNNKLQQLIMETKVDKNGDLIVNSKYGTTLGGTKSVARAWESTFPAMPSEYLINTPGGVELNAQGILDDFLVETSEGKWKLKKKDDYVDFYRSLGLNITDTAEIEKALANKHEVVNAIATRLKNYVEVDAHNTEIGRATDKITGLKSLFGTHEALTSDETGTEKERGLNSYYNTIQQIEFDLSDKFNSFMSINAPGDTQSELSLNSTASIVTNDINSIPEGTSLKDVIAEFPHLKFLDPANDPMIRANRYHKLLFDKNGTRTDVKLTLNNFSGSTLLQEDNFIGLTNMDLDGNSKFMTDVYLSFFNKSEVVRMADKSTSLHMGIDSKQTFGPAEILEAQKNPKDTTMFNELRDYLVAEIVRVNTLAEIKESGETLDKAYLERGNKLFIFDDIFTSKTKQMLLSLTDSTDFDTVSKTLNTVKTSDLATEVNKYFTDKTEYMMDNFATELFITDSMYDTVLQELPENISETADENTVREIMIGMFQRNKFLHNLDFTTLHLGDPALYNVEGEDFHKRNAGYISTGDIFRTDNAFFNFINSKDENGKIKARGWSNKVTDGKSEHTDYDGRLNTGVIADHIATSEYMDELRDALPGVNLKSYEEMEEGDGQGVIGFDSYRMMSISQGIWTAEQEAQYNLIVDRAIDQDGKMIPGKYDQTKFNEFFPSMKLQYFGPLDTNSPLRQQGFHKFNLVPLIPGMVQGTKLESLSNKMMEQGLDYVTFKSGSKLSTLSKDASGSDQYYNKDRSLNDNLVIEKNVIFAKYLKNQLKIHNKFKSKVTLPTQMRSILVSDLKGKDGKYLSPEHEQWHNAYLKNLTEIRNYKEQELYNELGIKDVKSLIQDSSKLVNMIRREFTSKDYTQSQIEFLFDNGNLKSDLSTALTADQVEKLLVSLIDKRLTKIKVNGEGLIQVASTMTEKKGTIQVKGDKDSGTNGLRSYHDKDGKTVGMQIKVALQGDFEKLLYMKGADGKVIAKYTTYKNADGTTTRELDYELSLERLNETIKDPKWLEENKDALRAVAPRIPSQGFNSLEFMEVAEFLPKNSGNIMIVPSEIVAKSGSDFDVDKLFTMFPNIDVYNGKVELVKHTTINTDVQGVKNKVAETKKKLNAIKESLVPLYKELSETKELIEIGNKINALVVEHGALEGNSDDLSIQRAEDIQKEVTALVQEQATYYDEIDSEFEDTADNEQLTDEKREIWKQIIPLKEKADAYQTEIDNYNREISGASIKGLENNLIELIAQRLSMKSVFSELVKPNTNDLVEPLAKELSEHATDYKKHSRINGTETVNKDNEKQISTTQIFDPMYNINKQLENAVGMDTLGVGAIGAKFSAIFQSIGMYLNPTNGLTPTEYSKLVSDRDNDVRELSPSETKAVDEYVDYRIQLKHNTKKEKVNGKMQEVIDLSQAENYSGERVADLLGQLINGWVDVAKDAWIFNIQGNKEVVPTLQFLLMAGVDFRQAVMLSSSKLVREYIDTKRKINSAFYGLSTLDQSNSKTFDLIKNQNDIDALNLVLENNNEEQLDNIEQVYSKSRNFTSPLEIEKDSTIEGLIKDMSKERNEKEKDQELQALLQFISYEQTAKQITALTMATKFDTSTSNSLAEVRSMQEKFDTLHQNKALPSDIQERMIKGTPIGMFNTNELQLELWGQFFSLKMHNAISDAANKGIKNRYQKGRTKVENEKDFSEEFISYLYQNESTRIENNTYNGYSLFKSEDSSVEEYRVEDGKFFYNDEFMEGMASKKFLGNKNSVLKFYIEKHIASENFDSEKSKDDISYKLAEKAIAASEDLTEEDIQEEFAEAEAMIKSGNGPMLFEGDYTYSKRLQELKEKHPTLADQFTLVNDLTPDTSKYGRENLYLLNLKEEGYKDIYEENLAILKEHPHPEIKEFFKMFDRFSVLQSGVKSYGKYVMTGIINQNHVANVINPVREDVISHFDALEGDRESSYPLLENFTENFYKEEVNDFKLFLMSKNRGAEFESDAYFENTFRELDKKALTLNSFPGNIPVIDMEIANASNKVIIHKVGTFPVKNYKKYSKINKYYSFINTNYTSALVEEYSGEDSVWITGETMNDFATGGKNNQATYQETLNRNFSSYKTSINDAIEQGTKVFNVGMNSGIDQMARKFLKDKSGFYEHKIVTKNGVYMQYSKSVEVTPERLYSTIGGEVNVNERFTTPMKDLKVNLSIGNKPYTNIFHYLAANKSRYSDRATRLQLKEKIQDKGSSFTEKDWVNLISGIKLGADKANYNETEAMMKAIVQIAETNSTFKTELEESGKSLLTLGKGITAFEKNFSRALLEARVEYNGPVTSTKNSNIKMPQYKVDVNLSNKDGSKRFASTNGTTIRVNTVTNVKELFDYMEGEEGGATSLQKQEVLKEMEKQGYGMSVVKELLTTPELAEIFLVLHEQDHIDHKDKDVYWLQGKDLMTEDKIAIEARASINALIQIEMDKYSGEDPITCKN
jgi:hypothetical protein